jgi:hypothetical protein
MKNLLLDIEMSAPKLYTIPNNLFNKFEKERKLFDNCLNDYESQILSTEENRLLYSKRLEILENIIKEITENYKPKNIDSNFRFI